MSIISKIQQEYQSLQPSQRKVADTVLEDPGKIAHLSISQTAMLSDTSVSAVLRFCKTIGYEGYKDFRYELLHSSQQERSRDEDVTSTITSCISEAVASLDSIDRKMLKQLCKDIIEAKHVVILGQYRSSLASEKLRMNLTDLGIPCYCADSPIAYEHMLNFIDHDTTVIVFSSLGYILNLQDFFQNLSASAENVWLVTQNQKSKMMKYISRVFLLPSVPNHGVFNSSHIILIAFADIVSAQMAEIRQSQSEN